MTHDNNIKINNNIVFFPALRGDRTTEWNMRVMGVRFTRFALTKLEDFRLSSFFFPAEVEVTFLVISIPNFMHLRSMQKASDIFNCSPGVTNPKRVLN